MSKYSTKPALDPDRQILVTLKMSRLLKLVEKAEAAGMSTHDFVAGKLIEVANA